MKLVLASGGSGGHISPALALGEEWVNRGGDVLYIGGDRGVEKELLKNRDYPFRTISASPLPRSLTPALLRSGMDNFRAFRQACRYLKEHRPVAVMGTGSYASAPTVMAALWQNIPTAIHEQNSYPGLANRLLARKVDMIAVSYSASRSFFPDSADDKIHVTGNPVRKSMLNVSSQEARQKMSIPDEAFTMLVAGGSQGARKINRWMIESYEELIDLKDFYILHITGRRDYEDVIKLASEKLSNAMLEKIHFISFCENMEYAMTTADIFVGRAGATTLAEITALGVPAILIPYPHAASNHQKKNARHLEEKGAANVILEENYDNKEFISMVERMYRNQEYLEKMSSRSAELGRQNSAGEIVDLLFDLLENSAKAGGDCSG